MLRLFIFILLIQLLLAASDVSQCKSAKYDYYSGFCYRFDASLYLEYAQAENNCRDTGDVLVSIHDAFVNTYVQNFNPSGVLIGYRYHADVDRYEWDDGSTIDYTNYAPDFVSGRDQNGYCTKLVNKKWTSVHCDTERLPFVCKHQGTPQTSPSECPGNEYVVYAVPGTIASPGYPAYYGLPAAHSACKYRLMSISQPYIKLIFEEMEFMEQDASIWVTDYAHSTQLAYAKKDFAGKSMFIRSQDVLLTMQGTTSGRWKITWATEEEDITVTPIQKCPDPNLIYYPPVTITSPGYPEHYELAAGWECEYKIAARTGKQISVYFEELVAYNACCYDAFLSWGLLAEHDVSFYFGTDYQGTSWNFTTDRLGFSQHDLSSGRYAMKFTEI